MSEEAFTHRFKKLCQDFVPFGLTILFFLAFVLLVQAVREWWYSPPTEIKKLIRAYQVTERLEQWDDACQLATRITMAFLERDDRDRYIIWKRRRTSSCAKKMDPNAPELVTSEEMERIKKGQRDRKTSK